MERCSPSEEFKHQSAEEPHFCARWPLHGQRSVLWRHKVPSIRLPWPRGHLPSPTRPRELEDARSLQTMNSGNLVSNLVSCLWWSVSGPQLLAFLYHESFSKTSAIQAAVLALKKCNKHNSAAGTLFPVSTLKLSEKYKQSRSDFLSGFIGSGTFQLLSGSTSYHWTNALEGLWPIPAAWPPA